MSGARPHPAELDGLLRSRRVRRARALPGHEPGALPTGFAGLDAALGGGWPAAALTEILPEREGIGELSVLLPALARLSRAGGWLAWVDPPRVPYAPALAAQGVDLSRLVVVRGGGGDGALWAAEQALRAPDCSAVLLWPAALSPRALRRLQLAAEAGATRGLLFRRGEVAARPSPAALRLRLAGAAAGGLRVEILRSRGRAPAAPIFLALAG